MASTNIKKYSVSPFLEVHENSKTSYKSVFVTQDLKSGIILSTFGGEVSDAPTQYTVEIGTNQHIYLEPEHLRYLNHSYYPTVFFDTTKKELLTLRAIQVGGAIYLNNEQWTQYKLSAHVLTKRSLEHG